MDLLSLVSCKSLQVINLHCLGFFIEPAATVIAERWFGAHERFWALVVGTYAAYAGWLFGYISPAYYMATYSLDVTALDQLIN